MTMKKKLDNSPYLLSKLAVSINESKSSLIKPYTDMIMMYVCMYEKSEIIFVKNIIQI